MDNYKEKYEQAFERARKLKENPQSVFNEYSPKEGDTICDYIFPELKESKDEKIRKAIKQMYSFLPNEPTYIGDVQVKDIFAWLEKQGEQKPANKVEPKFHKEQWIVWQDKCYKVNYNGCGYELIDQNGLRTSLEYGTVDKSAHLWTIADTKEGDVLHSIGWHNDCIFIFNGLDNWKFDEPNGDRAVATGYCCLSVSADKMEFGIQGPDCIEINTIKPATNIQRDLLFQKMKEAGYEWDAENKELKKIEQKPAWSEEVQEEQVSEEFINALGTMLNDGLPDRYLVSEERIKKSAELLFSIARKQLKNEMQEWSEEDEVNLNRLILYLARKDSLICEIKTKYIDWIKSLKDKIKGE